MVGEKESWRRNNNNKNSCSKQWTNLSTNDSINNQNLQYNIISNPSIDVESQQPIFPYKAKQQPNGLYIQLYVILNRFIHRFIYLDCLTLECILGICLLTHIELFFYSFNPNSYWLCFQNRSIRCFHWSIMIVVSLTIWLSSWVAFSHFYYKIVLWMFQSLFSLLFVFKYIYLLYFQLFFI